MAHKKYYYALIVLVVIMVFGTAAICNLCGAGAATTEKTGTDEETVAASTAKSADSTTVKDTKDSSTESTAKASESTAAATTADGTVAPTISLEIYEGPTYSAGDDICFYRIKATVTGNPAPTVTFSKDDSGGAWGAKKVQINIHRGQSYNLTAIAKNSAGEASASKNLTWGCGEENRNPVINDITLSSASIKTGQAYDVTGVASDADGDPLTYKWIVSGGGAVNDTLNTMKWTTPAAAGSYTITLKVKDGRGGEATQTKTVDVESVVASLSVPEVIGESGYIEQGGPVHVAGGDMDIFAGDSSTNKMIRGYVSFNTAALAGKTIDSAELTFNLKQTWGDSGFLGGLWVGVVNWGAEPLVPADFDLGGLGLQLFSSAGGGSFICNVAGLKTQLQNAVTAGQSRFQIRIHWSNGVSDLNNNFDGWEYDQTGGVILNITYH